jgi:Icc-related predicted phosphoesterase
LGAAVGLIVLGFIPAATSDTGTVTLSTSASIGRGSTAVDLPPLGAVSARTHVTPIDLHVAVDRVDFERLAPLATSPAGRINLRDDLTEDLRGLIWATGLRLVAGAVVLAALVGAAVFRHHLRPSLWAGAGAAAATLLLALGTGLTYDVQAFDEPRFSGSLTRAHEVVEALRRGDKILDQTRSRFEVASRRVSDLISSLATEDVHLSDDATVILHVSDLHANPLGLEITQELAAEFEVDAVIDSGDMFSSFLDTGELSRLSQPLDREMRLGVEGVPAPYFFVPGNHDAPGLLTELARADNLTIVDEDVIEVDGVRIMGWGDPTFSTRPVPIEEKDAERLSAGAADVLPEVRAESPDVLVVHDERLGLASVGEVPLILAGHTHMRGSQERGGTTILTVGSTGATGLKSLIVETDRSYEAQVIYLSEGRVASVDYVTLRGLQGDFQLERTSFDPAEAGA